MIVGVAFVPQTPLLVPEIARGAATELDDLRAAVISSIRRATGSADRIIVVGAGPATRSYAAGSRGTFAGFGVPVEVTLGTDAPAPLDLPISLTVGAWLVQAALGPETGAMGVAIGPSDELTGYLPDNAAVALVVVADGSARRSTAAPGYFDEGAAAFDARVATALRSGQGKMLNLDRELGAALLAVGVPVWTAVASLVEMRQSWDAELLYDAAPYGVGYFAASWILRG